MSQGDCVCTGLEDVVSRSMPMVVRVFSSVIVAWGYEGSQHGEVLSAVLAVCARGKGISVEWWIEMCFD